MNNKLIPGNRYWIIIDDQRVGGLYIKEINTLFGKRYLFEVGVNTYYHDTDNSWRHDKLFKIKEKNILL